MNGMESLKPGLYHDIIFYNISKRAVGVHYNPISFSVATDPLVSGWSHDPYAEKWRERDWREFWPKTNGSEFLFDAQDPRSAIQ